MAAIVLFSIVASATVLVPVVAVLALGDRTTEPLTDLKTWLLAHNATIMIVLFTVLGATMLDRPLPNTAGKLALAIGVFGTAILIVRDCPELCVSGVI